MKTLLSNLAGKARLATMAAVAGTAILAGSVTSLPAMAAEKVTYLLPAPAFLPAFAPWMLAKYNGYYSDVGLDVEFMAGKGGVDVAKQVGAGNAVIGGAMGDTPIFVRPNGIPVKAVAVLGEKSLMQLAVAGDSGITEPKDLKGKIITTIGYQDTTYYALLGMLASQGISKNDVEIEGAGPAGVWKMFIAGEADAMAAVPDWIGIARAQGKDVHVIPADEYFNSMAQAIIASDELIEKNPELIRKLVKATLKGMLYIMINPEQAAQDYVKAVPQHAGKEKGMEAVFTMYKDYVYGNQETLGAMDPDRLAKLQDFYLEQGIIRKSQNLDELYTNEFVE